MTSRIKSLITAAVATVLIAGSGMALAERRDHDRGHDRGHQGYSYDQHSGRHYDRGRHGNRHYYKHRGHYTYYGGGDERLLIGLIVGGLIGYAINDAQHRDGYYSRQSYPRNETFRKPVPAVEYEYRDYRSSTCLQEREYQTTVIVGGREVDAYGTACLQPDGSWQRGPVQLASF
jgi:hypothetical protein